MLLELAGKQDRKNKGYAFHRKHLRFFFLFSAQPEVDKEAGATVSNSVNTCATVSIT